MLQPRYVLFDAVGTLIYPCPSVGEVYAAAGQRWGVTLSVAQVKSRFAQAYSHQESEQTNEASELARWRQIVAQVFHELPDASQLFLALWEHFARSASWALYADVGKTWEKLEERGYQVGIASNFDARLVTVCRGLPPLDRCQYLFYSSLLGHSKPSPQFFASIEQRLHARPGEILLVGDDPERDYAGALAAGWLARRIDREGAEVSHETIGDLGEILTWLA